MAEDVPSEGKSVVFKGGGDEAVDEAEAGAEGGGSGVGVVGSEGTACTAVEMGGQSVGEAVPSVLRDLCIIAESEIVEEGGGLLSESEGHAVAEETVKALVAGAAVGEALSFDGCERVRESFQFG